MPLLQNSSSTHMLLGACSGSTARTRAKTPVFVVQSCLLTRTYPSLSPPLPQPRSIHPMLSFSHPQDIHTTNRNAHLKSLLNFRFLDKPVLLSVVVELEQLHQVLQHASLPTTIIPTCHANQPERDCEAHVGLLSVACLGDQDLTAIKHNVAMPIAQSDQLGGMYPISMRDLFVFFQRATSSSVARLKS